MKTLKKFFSMDNLRKALNGLLLISLLFAWVAYPKAVIDDYFRRQHENY